MTIKLRKFNYPVIWKIYKKILRRSFALVLFLFAVILVLNVIFKLINPAAKAGNDAARLEGAVKGTASVSYNSTNQIAEQLKLKEERLTNFEDRLRESMLSAEGMMESFQNRIILSLAVIGGILFLLIFLNFCLDWKRIKFEMNGKFVK